MAEITQDTTVDVVETCFNKIPSSFGRKLAVRFVERVDEYVRLHKRPAGHTVRPRFFDVLSGSNREAVITAIEMVTFEVPRANSRQGGKYYMLHWIGDVGYHGAFLINAVYPRD